MKKPEDFFVLMFRSLVSDNVYVGTGHSKMLITTDANQIIRRVERIYAESFLLRNSNADYGSSTYNSVNYEGGQQQNVHAI